MCSTWLATVLGEITSSSAISLFESPRASSRSTSTSRCVRPAGPSRRREGLRLAQHPLCEVGLEAQVLPIAAGERAALVEHGVRDAQPAEVVDEAGAAEQADLGLADPEPGARLGRELAHRA